MAERIQSKFYQSPILVPDLRGDGSRNSKIKALTSSTCVMKEPYPYTPKNRKQPFQVWAARQMSEEWNGGRIFRTALHFHCGCFSVAHIRNIGSCAMPCPL